LLLFNIRSYQINFEFKIQKHILKSCWEIFAEILDFVVPPLCVSCNSPLNNSELQICNNCAGKLVRFTSQHPWLKEYVSRGYIDSSFSLYQFMKDTPIQHLLHSLKYEKMKSVGLKLGEEIGRNIPPGVKYDYSVPVPLHKAKIRERTYNQSALLCKGIDRVAGTQMFKKLLLRKRFTKSQTKLDKNQRLENVKGAFEINRKHKSMISGKNIILADDVITTGATILECALVLKKAGAGKVWICSAAYAELKINVV
jgi:ComF family protein